MSSAFVEYKHVRQEPGRRRRWFQSPLGDLMVWYAPGGDDVSGLQFCHAEDGRERVYTWRPGDIWRQHVVDTGTRPPLGKLTPILVGTTPVPLDGMKSRIRTGLPGMEPGLAAVINGALGAAGEPSAESTGAGNHPNNAH